MNLHSPSKSNTKQIVHKLLALFWYVCILRLAISPHVYFAKNAANTIFPFNSWSVFSNCVVFYGDGARFKGEGKLGSCPGASTTKGPPRKTVKSIT